MSGSLRDQLELNNSDNPNSIWLISPDTGQQINWRDARDTAQDIAARLVSLNIPHGASVGIASHNSLGACLAIAGITYGGYLATPINLVAGAKAMSYVLNHCKADVIFCAPDNRELIDIVLANSGLNPIVIPLPSEGAPIWPDKCTASTPQMIPVPTKQTPGILIYTSGTTGNPKGVVLSHGNLLAAGNNPVQAHNITRDDTGLCVLPIYHINGLCVSVMGTLVSASQLVIPYKFSASIFWQQVYDYHVSWFSAVPTLFAYLLNDETEPRLNRERLRFSRSASAPLSPEIHRRFEERFGIPIIETMGLTETGAQILSNPMPPAERKIGSPGKAVGNEIMIACDDLSPAATGQSGEILVRGDNVMQEYLHQPEETAKTITSGGWLRTGDIGHIDKDGFVFVTGRIKELIIKGGENIAPREIDEVLLEHNTILEAAAFAVPCVNYGQRVEACIRFKSGKDADVTTLLAHCRKRLGKFKCPDDIHIMDDLPKGPSGKVQRLKLFELIYQGK